MNSPIQCSNISNKAYFPSPNHIWAHIKDAIHNAMVAYPGDQGSLDRRSMDLHFIQKIKIFLQQVHLQQVHQNDIDLEISKNERTRSKAVFQPKRVGWSLGVAL